MKKSVKILTLVLSLALLCGALVVAAFAEDSTEIVGVRLDLSADFEDTLITEIPTAESDGAGSKAVDLDKDTGAAKTVQFKHQKGGQPILVVNPVDNNTYVTVDWTQNPNTSNGHILDGYTAKSAWKNYKEGDSAEYFGTDTKYFVMDVDLKWDDPASYDGTGFFYPYIGYTNAAGTGHKPVSDYVGVRFPVKEGKVVAQIKGDADYYPIGSDGKWSHVTYIMGFEKVTDADGTNLVIKQWLAIDGVIVDSYNWTNSVAAADVYKEDRTLLFTKDIRLDVFGKKTTAASADNYKIRTILPTYNGNLDSVLAGGIGADLTTWESAVYNDDYVMPFGEAMVKNGDKYYDALDKAVADAADGDTITLLKNITTPVVIDKVITIECGEYTIADIKAGQGYRCDYNEETKTYVSETTQGAFYITWEACDCGLDSCDETHPGGIDTEGWEGGTIGASYTKSQTWSVSDGPIVYSLAGWVDEEGNPVDMDTIITTEMCEDIIEIVLYPVIKISTPAFSYTTNSGVSYTDEFTAAVNGVSDNGTITLMRNAQYISGSALTISKNVTINLNGFVFDTLIPTKISGYIVVNSNKTLTFLGEKEGSAVVNAYPMATSGAQLAGGTFLKGNSGATMKFIGPNLTVSTAAFYANWSGPSVTLVMDGVTFYQRYANDNPAGFYHKGAADITIKNCVFDMDSGRAFVGLTNSGAESTVRVENSVINGDLVSATYPYADVEITDSYVSGAIKGNSITVNGTCYFGKNNWAEDADFGEGLALSPMTGIAEHDTVTHPWAVVAGSPLTWDHEASTVFTKGVFESSYAYTTAKTVKINVYDGATLLNTVNSVPGFKFVAHQVDAAVADGWVNSSTQYWYTVAEDATADINVDIADLTAKVTYTVGTPKFYFNYYLSDNMSSNLYVPSELPEGIELTYVALKGSNTNRLEKNWIKGDSVIGGVKYDRTQAWPCGYGADEGSSWTFTFTYDGETFEYVVKMDVVSYAKKVADIYATDTEKLQQITAVLQYVEASNNIKGDAISNGLSEYLTTLKETVTIPAITAETPYMSDLSQLRQYISGAKMVVKSGKGGSFAFTLTEAVATNNLKIQLAVGERVLATETKDNEVYTFSDGLAVWGAKDITISVLDAEGAVVATGTYSLAAYKNEMASEATADQLALLDAIYAIAVIGNTND